MTTRNNDSGLQSELSRSDFVAGEFAAQYHLYQYQFVEFLTTHLLDLSCVFKGDFQEVMILALVGQVRLQGLVDSTGGHPNGKTGEATITASRIADITGIPRQTVRRKLTALEARGWLEKTPDASYRLAAIGEHVPVRQELSAFDERAIRRVARLFCGLERLLAKPVT